LVQRTQWACLVYYRTLADSVTRLLSILSKTLAALVFCFAAVFLLDYACGIRIPDLNVFFLPASTGQRLTLYAARPTAERNDQFVVRVCASDIPPPLKLAEKGIPNKCSGRGRVANRCRFQLFG
jgi:hypothetical protein